jgi:DNA-binding transcriptional LysR family regulator
LLPEIDHSTRRAHLRVRQIENGTLVRLLPKWSSAPVSVHAVYPTRKFLPEKMQVFLQALRAWRSPFWVSA